jgi:hypothetical protein
MGRDRTPDEIVRDYKDIKLVNVVCVAHCPYHGFICAWRKDEHPDPFIHRCIIDRRGGPHSYTEEESKR